MIQVFEAGEVYDQPLLAGGARVAAGEDVRPRAHVGRQVVGC